MSRMSANQLLLGNLYSIKSTMSRRHSNESSVGVYSHQFVALLESSCMQIASSQENFELRNFKYHVFLFGHSFPSGLATAQPPCPLIASLNNHCHRCPRVQVFLVAPSWLVQTLRSIDSWKGQQAGQSRERLRSLELL